MDKASFLETKIQKLKDGRDLAYAEYGNAKGIPVFYAHGGPGSHLEGQFFHEEATKHGFRFIATDRPGMGDSTYLENRTLLDYPSDIRELADSLDIDKFGVMGWSGGGAHTTVCGYAIPERLLFNFSFAGYTNFAELPEAEKYLKTKMDVDWGFRLKDIPVKLNVFHGTKDTLVPFEYGKHIAENVPNCTLHAIEDEGHFFPYSHLYEIFDFAKKEAGM